MSSTDVPCKAATRATATSTSARRRRARSSASARSPAVPPPARAPTRTCSAGRRPRNSGTSGSTPIVSTSASARPGPGRLVLVPGDANGGQFSFDGAVVDRCIDLFLRLLSEFEVVLVDLSAGRSYAAEIVIAATSSPALINVTTRWLVFHRWTRQHILAAHGLVYGERGLLDISEAHGRDRDQFIDGIRFVRTAIVDPNAPDLSGLRPEQLAWLREANRGLQQLAAERGVGRPAMLGAVPLDPILQWREQLITDSDVRASRVANEATTEAFDSIAKKITDDSAWEPMGARERPSCWRPAAAS